jgi:hypothetical protein
MACYDMDYALYRLSGEIDFAENKAVEKYQLDGYGHGPFWGI